MTTYSVGLPITGVIYVEVEAENEENAIELAFESDQILTENIEAWEVHRQIVQGNIFYGAMNEAEVEEMP